MSRPKTPVYKSAQTRNGESMLTHKFMVLFTEEEARAIIHEAAVADRSGGNLIPYVMREYLLGRVVLRDGRSA